MKLRESFGLPSEQSRPSENRVSSVSEISDAPPSIEFIPAGVTNGRWKPEQIRFTCYRCKQLSVKLSKDYRREERRTGHPPSKQYCSKECRSNPGLYICPQCGGWKAQMATTCKDCYLKDKHVLLTCKQCGVDFKRPRSEHEKNIKRMGEDTGNAFCGQVCYLKHKAENPPPPSSYTGTCKRCGKPVMGNKKYCGMTCYSARARRPDGSFRPYSGGWNQERHKTKQRYDGVCAMCDRKKDRVQVHHIDHDSTNHVAKNLVLLCEPCHGFYHQAMSDAARATMKTLFVARASGS